MSRHHSKYHTLRNKEYSWELMVHPHLYMNIIQFQLRKPRQTTLRNWLQTTFLVITKVSTLNYQQWIQIMMIKFSALYCIITSSHAVTIIQYSFHQKFSQGMQE